jgi:hypothetical protein
MTGKRVFCNIGRRSPVTHQALLDEADLQQSFYYYDTVAASGADLKHRTFRIDSPHEHRGMLATLLNTAATTSPIAAMSTDRSSRRVVMRFLRGSTRPLRQVR